LTGGAALEGDGELVIERDSVFQLVFAREDVAARTQRVGRMSRCVSVAALSTVALVFGTIESI